MFELIDSYFDVLELLIFFVFGMLTGAVMLGVYLAANDFLKSDLEEPYLSFPPPSPRHYMETDEMTQHIDEALAVVHN